LFTKEDLAQIEEHGLSEAEINRQISLFKMSPPYLNLLGPALAGLLSVTAYGEAAPVLGAVVISLIGTALIVFYIPENKECSLEGPADSEDIRKVFGYEIKECRTARETGKPSFREVLKLPNIPYMLGLYFLIFLGFNIFYTAFPLHAIAALDWGIAEMGVYFTVLSALLIIVQGPILSRLSKRYSDASLIIVGSLMLGTNFLLLLN